MADRHEQKTKPNLETGPSANRPLARSQTTRAPANTEASTPDEVAAFVDKLKTLAPVGSEDRGRLVFAMDATMSRQPTWDMALTEQAQMFEAVRDVGGLDVQLIYFRGAGECRASKWVSQPDALKRLMTTVSCQGGITQIGKVLNHVRKEADQNKINAVVYVGDAMEENIDMVCAHAGELALLGVPVFVFQEGDNSQAEVAFREIARLTKGSWCRFKPGASAELRALLQAVAVYAAGGRKALIALGQRDSHGGARRLLADLTSGR